MPPNLTKGRVEEQASHPSRGECVAAKQPVGVLAGATHGFTAARRGVTERMSYPPVHFYQFHLELVRFCSL